jgi:hypothetical protein
MKTCGVVAYTGLLVEGAARIQTAVVGRTILERLLEPSDYRAREMITDVSTASN